MRKKANRRLFARVVAPPRQTSQLSSTCTLEIREEGCTRPIASTRGNDVIAHLNARRKIGILRVETQIIDVGRASETGDVATRANASISTRVERASNGIASKVLKTILTVRRTDLIRESARARDAMAIERDATRRIGLAGVA